MIIDLIGFYFGIGVLWAAIVFTRNSFLSPAQRHNELGIILLCVCCVLLWPVIAVLWTKAVLSERFGG